MALDDSIVAQVREGLELPADTGELPQVAPPSPNFELPATPSLSFQPTQIEIEEAEADERPGFWNAMGASFSNDNSAAAINRWLSTDFPIDNEFDIEALDAAIAEPDVKKRVEALPLEINEMLGGAQSREHLDYLLDQAEQEHKRELLIAAAGAKGLTARVLANVLDPVDLTVVAMAAPLGAAMKANKLRRAVQTGLTAGAANAAVEGVVAAQSPFRDTSDVLTAALAGFALGAPLGALGRTVDADISRIATDGIRNVSKGDDAFAPGGANLFATFDDPSLAPTSKQRVMDDILDPDYTPEFSYAGAQKAQFNFGGTLLASESIVTRGVASRMIETGVPLKNLDETKRFTAEGRANFVQRTMDNELMKAMSEPFKAWGKQNGFGRIRMAVTAGPGKAFREEVGMAIRGTTAGISKEAIQAAAKVRPLLKEWLNMAKEAKVKGFENVNENDLFFPRMYSQQKWLHARAEFSEEGIVRFFRGAIMAADGDIPVEIAVKIARAMERKITRNAAGMDVDLAHGIPMDDFDRLREFLDGDADEVIAALETLKSKQMANAGRVKHAKNRMKLDETYAVPMLTKSGATKTLKLSDLTENDAARVLMRYGRVLSGHIGLAKEANITSKADLEAVKKTILDEAVGNPKRLDQARKEATSLDEVYKLLTGTALEADPYSDGAIASRLLSAYNYTRVGGGFGIAQIPELGNVIGAATISGFIKHLPDFAKMLKRGQNGELDNELIRAMDEAFAPGTDWIRHPTMAGFDEMGLGFDADTLVANVAKKIDPAIQTGSRLTAALSLMAPINASLQRMAGVGYGSRLADIARGKKKLTPKMIQRLKDAGLSDEMRERVFQQLRDHATFDGGRLRNPSLAQWADDEARDAFRMAGNRWTRRVVQENDLGNTSGFLHKPLGRLTFQFMSFMLNSINKQLLHGARYRDVQTFVSWSTAMFFASLAYTGQTYVNYATDPEQRKKRLAPEKIAAAAFSRAGFAAIMPALIDNARMLGGFDPWFSHARTSGLGTTIIDSNPSVMLARDLVGVAATPGRLLHDNYRFSQEDSRRMFNVLPLHNLLGIRNALSLTNESLPRRSREE